MAEPNDQTGPGDSTPNFAWLHDQDAPADAPWLAPGGQDSALDMLPPEEQPEALEASSRQSDEPSFAATEPLPVADEPEPTVQWTAEASPPAESAAVDPAAAAESTSPAAAAMPAAAAPPPTAEPARVSKSGSTSTTPPSSDRTVADRDRLMRIGLISYASAATLVLVYLLLTMSTAKPHQLESLPDVEPLQDGVSMELVIPGADMPPGHTLKLGESQRFGNILVEPLRVTREPIEFAHFSGPTGIEKPATNPVLKLWVRFTNVSADQTIAPVDAGLLFARQLRNSGRLRANQFVCRASDKTDDGEQVLVFDHPPTSEWDLVGQQLGTPLAPGEAVEIFVPTEESGLDALTGELIWRVHFRKGYSPKGYGVTTVIEVAFDSSQIQAG